MDDSQASLLTESQRQYLRDGTTLDGEPVSNPHEYDRNIRKRVAQALFDLNILFNEWDPEELRKVFSKRYSSVEFKTDDTGEEYPYCEVCEKYVDSVQHDCQKEREFSNWYSTSPGAFAFFTWALNVTDDPLYPPYETHQPAFNELTEAIERGISKCLTEKHDLVANVSVSIELSDVDRIDELYADE
jgi:hypothetical protein